MAAVGCLYECLREAKLDQYYPHFKNMQVTSLESLVSLSMQDYDRCGVTSAQDKHRLFELIQIVKDVQQHSGKHCSKGCGRHGEKSSPQMSSQQGADAVMDSNLTTPEKKSEGYTLIFNSVKKRLAMKDKNMQTSRILTGFTVVDIPSSQYLQKKIQSMSPPRHTLQIPTFGDLIPQAWEESQEAKQKNTQSVNTVISVDANSPHHYSYSSHPIAESAKHMTGGASESVSHRLVTTSTPQGISRLEESYLQYLTPSGHPGSLGPNFGPPKARESFVEKIHHGNGYNYGLPRRNPHRRSVSSNKFSQEERIKVCVRKRPLNRKEKRMGEKKIVDTKDETTVFVSESKVAIDLTDFMHQHEFVFDEVFDEDCSNQEVYERTAGPLVDCVFQGGSAVCFAYGQTGAGKTYTMMGKKNVPGLYVMAADHVFQRVQEIEEEEGRDLRVWVSYVEIYLNQLFDLLDKRKRVHVREDGRHNVLIRGLCKTVVRDVQTLMAVIEAGNSLRSTGTTGVNPDSSRSHAILQLEVRDQHERRLGKMSFIDLAGSERLCEVTDFSNKQNRLEGAEINQSLLALKECIRSIDQATKHTPFRQSKLTHILKDSFVGNSKTCMIANISPGQSACDHTLNTLRYADRVKELKRSGSGDRLDNVEKTMADLRSKSQSPSRNCNSKNSSSTTPSVFHPSSIPLSSTPKKSTPLKSKHDSQKKQPFQGSMYETPIRGHKIKRKTAELKTNGESSSTSSQRNKHSKDRIPLRVVREPSSESGERKNSQNERNDGNGLKMSALLYETVENNRNIHYRRQQPETYQKSEAAHETQHTAGETNEYYQSFALEKDNQTFSQTSSSAGHQSEIVTHLDNIMAHAQAVLDKSQNREENNHANHDRVGNNRHFPVQAWDQMTISNGHPAHEPNNMVLWRKYNEPIPPVNLHRYHNEHIPASPPHHSQSTSTTSSPKSPDNRRPKLSPLLPDKNFNFLHLSRSHGSPTYKLKLSTSADDLGEKAPKFTNVSDDSKVSEDHTEMIKSSPLDAKRKLFKEEETNDPISSKPRSVTTTKDMTVFALTSVPKSSNQVEGKVQPKEPVLGQQAAEVVSSSQKEGSSTHREWHPKSALAQKIQSLPSPDDFLKSLAEIRLQKKTQREPNQKGKDSDSESGGDKMSPRSPPSSECADYKGSTPAVGQSEVMCANPGKSNDLRPFPDLLVSPSNSRRSGAFQPYSHLPPNKLTQISPGISSSQQGSRGLANCEEEGQKTESAPNKAVVSQAPAKSTLSSFDQDCNTSHRAEDQHLNLFNTVKNADPKELITKALPFTEEKDKEAVTYENSTNGDPRTLSEKSPVGEDCNVVTDLQKSDKASSAQERMLGNDQDRKGAPTDDSFTDSSKTTLSSSSCLSSSGLDSSATPSRRLDSNATNGSQSSQHSSESHSDFLKLPPPPQFVTVNKSSSAHTASVNTPVRIERLEVSGIPGTTFSPIHPSPSLAPTKLVTVPTVITKTIIADDNISNGRLLKGTPNGRGDSDRGSSMDKDGLVLTRGDSAQEKAQNLLITSHEEQLAEMTALCKEEMRLLRSIKNGDLTFPTYVKELKSVLSSKCRCIETLSGQLAELSAYTFDSPHQQFETS